MRNVQDWKPTKFVRANDYLRSDRTGAFVNYGSRIVADIMAFEYDKALKNYAHGRLLDLGCGSVPLYEAYRPYVSDIVCADWPSSGHDSRHVDVFTDLNHALPFADEIFDTIILSDVLEHIARPEELMIEISRISKRGGMLILGVPFLYWLHEEPHDYNRYTRHQLERFCNLAGLEVVSLREVGGAPEVLVDVAGKVLSGRRRLLFVYEHLASALLRTNLVRRISTRTRAVLPMGYLLSARRKA